YFCYHQHHNGKLNRFKVRIREYSVNNCPYFEIKKKLNTGFVHKIRLKIDSKINTLGEKESLLLNSEIGNLNTSFVPSLTNSFNRIILVNKIKTERITFDFNIEFELNNNKIQLKNHVLAELKQAGKSVSEFKTECKKLNIFPNKFSK